MVGQKQEQENEDKESEEQEPKLVGEPVQELEQVEDLEVSELLKVADVQTHVCAIFFSICPKFVFLNTKQEKPALFYDFATI